MAVSNYLSLVLEPKLLKDLLTTCAKELKGIEFNIIAVTGNSGTIFGGALAAKLDKPLLLVRKPSDHAHSKQRIESHTILGEFTYIFVDDLAETGDTVKRVKQEIKKEYPLAVKIGNYFYRYSQFIKAN